MSTFNLCSTRTTWKQCWRSALLSKQRKSTKHPKCLPKSPISIAVCDSTKIESWTSKKRICQIRKTWTSSTISACCMLPCLRSERRKPNVSRRRRTWRYWKASPYPRTGDSCTWLVAYSKGAAQITFFRMNQFQSLPWSTLPNVLQAKQTQNLLLLLDNLFVPQMNSKLART